MTEQKLLRESYKEKIKTLKDVSINDYLKEGYELDKDSIIKAVEYFKSCMPIGLKLIILKQDYWDLYYNKPMVDLIIKNYELQREEDIKAVGTFVYAYQSDKRDFEELEDENILKEKLIKEGFKEFSFIKILDNEKHEEFYKRRNETFKPLNNLKVVCVFDKEKIGFMGSYTNKEQHEGKLIFDENQNGLFFLPKRHTRTGQRLVSKFYYKIL